VKLKDLADIIQILKKYSADSWVSADHDVIYIEGPQLKDIFDEEDVKILSEKGCRWAYGYWELR
jgi:hypothetical protein